LGFFDRSKRRNRSTLNKFCNFSNDLKSSIHKRYNMESGYFAKLRKRQDVSYTVIYKLGKMLSPVGKIFPTDVCLVADAKPTQKLVVTPRGEVGWVHEAWIEKIN